MKYLNVLFYFAIVLNFFDIGASRQPIFFCPFRMNQRYDALHNDQYVINKRREFENFPVSKVFSSDACSEESRFAEHFDLYLDYKLSNYGTSEEKALLAELFSLGNVLHQVYAREGKYTAEYLLKKKRAYESNDYADTLAYFGIAVEAQKNPSKL